MEVTEKDGKIVAEASMVGIPVENITVSYDENRILRAEGKLEEKTDGREVKRRVTYATLLSSGIDAASAEATVENGMLTIKASAGKRIEATKIPVKVVEKKK